MRLFEYRDNARLEWLPQRWWDWSLYHVIGRPYRRVTHHWEAPVVASVQRESILDADATLPFDPRRRPAIACRVYCEANMGKESKDEVR